MQYSNNRNIVTMTIWQPTLDRSKPLYLAIADALARDVADGVLPEGSRLPPQRELAWKLGVTLGTVTRAYREAETRGFLNGEVGRGSYVRKPIHASPLVQAVEGDPGLSDLSHAVPPPVVKTEELDAAMQFVMRDARRLDLLDYAPPEGFHMHRKMAVEWLRRSNIEVHESQVLISAGAHLGLITVLEALTEAGDRVMAENTNYALLRATFKNARLEPVGLPMDDEGLIPAAMEEAIARTGARFIYVVPSLQNPTTSTMSRRRRDDIVHLARKHDVTIIEDDIFRLLDTRVQPPTFYELAPERTFHITSLSKTLAPGLRIGFVVSPTKQERILRAFIRNMAARTVGITGEIARFWIESGIGSQILARGVDELMHRRQLFMQVFKDYTFRCQPGAPYAWLELPTHWTPSRYAQALMTRKIRITPSHAFELTPGQPSRHVRVCFGGPGHTGNLRTALETAETVLRQAEEEDFFPVA
jgi:DNA-binding transcriptional MocR family regulator